MRLITNGTQVAAMPNPAGAIGTPGYATNGDPASGLEATIIDADLINIILAELTAVINASGIALDSTGADRGQLWRALEGHLSARPLRQELIDNINTRVSLAQREIDLQILWEQINKRTTLQTREADNASLWAGIAERALSTTVDAHVANLNRDIGGRISWTATTQALGISGFIVHPGGLFLQWGRGASGENGVGNTFFPARFPGACAIVLMNESSASGWGGESILRPTWHAPTTHDQNGFTSLSARHRSDGVVEPQPSLGFSWLSIGW